MNEELQQMLNKLPEGDRKKVLNFIKLEEEGADLGIYEELCKINESLAKISEKEMPKMEMPEVQKIKIDGIEVMTLKGDTPTDEHLTELITPLIPEPIKGNDYILTEKDKKEIASKIQVPIVVKEIETIIEKQPIVTNEVKEVREPHHPNL